MNKSDYFKYLYSKVFLFTQNKSVDLIILFNYIKVLDQLNS